MTPMRRTSVEIPLKDSPDETSCPVSRSFDDLCVDVWNLVQKWNAMNGECIQLAEAIANCRMVSDKESTTTTISPIEEDKVQIFSPRENCEKKESSMSGRKDEGNFRLAMMMEKSERISDLLEEMGMIVAKMNTAGQRTAAMCLLLVDDERRKDKVLTAQSVFIRLFNQLTEELQCKRTALMDLGESKNREVLTASIASFLHQPFIDRSTVEELRSLIV